MVTVNAGMSTFSGVVKADTVITNASSPPPTRPAPGTSGDRLSAAALLRSRSETTGHDIGWVTAAPLWSGLIGADPGPEQLPSMQRPVLLRLETDEFMDDLNARLAADPPSLVDLVATPKTFRPGPPGATTRRGPIDHVKLFQPVHGHFNLVAATLVCRVPGLPDRSVDPASKDEVGFVLRRINGQQESGWTE